MMLQNRETIYDLSAHFWPKVRNFKQNPDFLRSFRTFLGVPDFEPTLGIPEVHTQASGMGV